MHRGRRERILHPRDVHLAERLWTFCGLAAGVLLGLVVGLVVRLFRPATDLVGFGLFGGSAGLLTGLSSVVGYALIARRVRRRHLARSSASGKASVSPPPPGT